MVRSAVAAEVIYSGGCRSIRENRKCPPTASAKEFGFNFWAGADDSGRRTSFRWPRQTFSKLSGRNLESRPTNNVKLGEITFVSPTAFKRMTSCSSGSNDLFAANFSSRFGTFRPRRSCRRRLFARPKRLLIRREKEPAGFMLRNGQALYIILYFNKKVSNINSGKRQFHLREDVPPSLPSDLNPFTNRFLWLEMFWAVHQEPPPFFQALLFWIPGFMAQFSLFSSEEIYGLWVIADG